MSAANLGFLRDAETITLQCLHTLPCSFLANMDDDEKEVRAVELASQALELIASGEDEVREWRYAVCNVR